MVENIGDRMTCSEKGWKTWTFGEVLRLERAEASGPDGATRRERSLTEEGLETLLMLNLDELFSGLSLRLSPKRLGEWSGCDIGAVDPTGRRHIFELKHEATARDVVDQAIAYGFQALNQRSFEWFDEQESRKLVTAARLAGFWNGERVQNYSLPGDGNDLAPERRIRKTIEMVSAEGRGADDWLKKAEERLKPIQPSAAWLRNADSSDFDLSGVHLHMVVPYGDSIDDYALESLGRLVKRGLYATIWETAVSLENPSGEPGQRKGELWLRPYHIGGAGDSSGRQGKRDSAKWSLSAEDVLNQMALQDAGLDVLRSEWNHTPSAKQCETLAWPRTDRRQTLSFKVEVEGPEVTCRVSTSKRSWQWDNPDQKTKKRFRDRIRDRRSYIAEWMVRVLELEGFAEEQGGDGDAVDWFSVSSSERWAPESEVDESHEGWARTKSRGLPVHAKHANGMFGARFTVNVAEHGIEAAADVCADALASFRALAATARYDKEAFGPFYEEDCHE